MYVTLILARRNLHTIYVLTLQLVNEVFNYVLKNTFKEPRRNSNRTGDYGFPSIILNCQHFLQLIGPCISCFERIVSFLMFLRL